VGGKDMMVVFTSKFLVLVFSTFHPITVHILKSNPLLTGGKDRSTIIPAKCFF